MRQTSIYKTVLTVFFCLCIGCIGGLIVAHYLNGGFDRTQAQGTQVVIEENSSIAQVARAYQDCVVSIKAVNKTNSSSFSLGSGVCVRAGGYIVTNYHVISSAISNSNYQIQVYLNGNTTQGHIAELLWANNDLDLAIIKSSYTDITYAKMRDRTYFCESSVKIDIGDEVISIGTPIELTLQNTTMFGRVNGLNRIGAANGNAINSSDVRVYEYLIQHQATINSGNSGGPLIDADGYVIGINSCSMVEDKNDEYVANINYAVPIYPVIAIINDVVTQYEAGASFIEPYIGVTAIDKNLSSYASSSFTSEGVYIQNVSLSGASRGKLIASDVIKSISYGSTTKNIGCLYDLYYNCFKAGKGAVVTLEVVRGFATINVEITLP